MSEQKPQDRIRCAGCSIPILDPGEYPDPDALLCDRCVEEPQDRAIVAECWTCGVSPVPGISAHHVLHWEKWHRRCGLPNYNNPAPLHIEQVSTHRAAGHDVREVKHGGE